MPHNKPILPSRRQLLRGAGLAAGAAAASQFGLRSARAAGYPDRPVKIIVPFAPAGPTDIMARILPQISAPRSAATSSPKTDPAPAAISGSAMPSHAEPDGYTLLVDSSAYVVNPGLYAKVPYDPYKDFAPITELGTSPN